MVIVSHDALCRGRLERDELCVIPGFGDVPIDVPHRLLDEDAFLTGLLHDGERVQLVRRFGRRPSAAVKAALVAQAVVAHGQVVCDVDGCDRADIEWDQTLPFTDGGPSSAANLASMCRGHHRAKTVEENHARSRNRRTAAIRRTSDSGPAP
jgi:hypothetical protein